jgi:hypothetical protein
LAAKGWNKTPFRILFITSQRILLNLLFSHRFANTGQENRASPPSSPFLFSMGLFTRRAAPVSANTNTATGTLPIDHDGVAHHGTHPTTTNTTSTGHREKGFRRQLGGRHHGTYPDSLNSRPTFGE